MKGWIKLKCLSIMKPKHFTTHIKGLDHKMTSTVAVFIAFTEISDGQRPVSFSPRVTVFVYTKLMISLYPDKGVTGIWTFSLIFLLFIVIWTLDSNPLCNFWKPLN